MRVFLFIFITMFLPALASAQSRVNLEDVKIDGELQKEGLSLSSRQHFSIESEIEVRESFNDLLLQYLPQGYRKPAQEISAK